jgi:hypothetical protein
LFYHKYALAVLEVVHEKLPMLFLHNSREHVK